MDTSMLALYLMIGIVYVFPIIAAFFIFRKGRKGWGVATLVTTLFGIGWLVAIIALLVRPRQPGALETPCPDCGETKGFTYTGLVNRNTGKPTIGLFQAAIWALVAIFFIGGALWMAISTWQYGDSGVVRWQYGSGMAGLAMLAIGIGFGQHGVRGVLEYLTTDRLRIPMYECSRCGKRWNRFGERNQAASVGIPSMGKPE